MAPGDAVGVAPRDSRIILPCPLDFFVDGVDVARDRRPKIRHRDCSHREWRTLDVLLLFQVWEKKGNRR